MRKYQHSRFLHITFRLPSISNKDPAGPHACDGMTKYHVDRIITGVYVGPLAKRYCAVLHHALTLMWTVMTLPKALDAFTQNHFVLLVDRCAESGPNVKLCDSDSIDD